MRPCAISSAAPPSAGSFEGVTGIEPLVEAVGFDDDILVSAVKLTEGGKVHWKVFLYLLEIRFARIET